MTGPLTAAEIAETAARIAAVQLPTGMIPWFPGGHADPWNHIEAAMALVLAGRRSEADRAFDWLASTQLRDGTWCRYHLAEGIEDPRRDPNVGAYVATGAWWHYLCTGDLGLLEGMWPIVEAAVGFVLRLQLPGGEVLWSMDPDGYLGPLRPAHQHFVDPPQPPVRHCHRRAPRVRTARMGAGRRSDGRSDRPPAGQLSPQRSLGHGLVLPGPLGGADR